MVKTKRILIALAVIGANVLHTMPVHTALAEYDYTITDGIIVKNSSYSDGHTYSSTIFGNTELGTSALSGIEMVIRDGTYNASSVDGSVQMVGSNVGGANISNNHLTINNATINSLYGAYYKYSDYPGVNGTLENNSITIYDGTYQNVYTAYATYGNLTSNILTVEGGTFKKHGNEHIAAGYVYSSGNAISNQFIINGGTFENLKYIYGGYVGSGNVIGNIITINDGAFSDTGNWIYIFGGHGEGGDNVDDGNVTKNIVNIKGGSFDNINFSIYGGYLNGTSDYGSISENEVNVSGGTFNAKMSFYGGSLPRNDLNAVSIEKNKVTIKNVTLANGSEIYGGQSSKVKIDSNIVTIDSGTFNNVLIVGGKSETAEVLNNSVILNGGNFTGGTKIVAGIGVNDSAKFSGNSISLAGSNALDLSGASLMGYETSGDNNSTLNVKRTNVKVGDIQKFGTINFNLTGASSDAIVLKMDGTFDVSTLNSVTIDITNSPLTGNDYIVLMQNVIGDYGGSSTGIMKLDDDLIYYTGTAPTAPKADYTITGTTVINSPHSDGHTYSTEIIGNTDTLASELSDINMVVRRGTYENTIYGVKYEVDDSSTVISNNKVTIHDGSFNAVYNVRAQNGQVTGNILTIEDGKFANGSTCNIYAGYVAETGKVEGNKLIINGGDVGKGKTVAAGYIFGTGDAIGNEITITGGKIGGDSTSIAIYGAEFNKGSATGNKVKISGGEFGEWVTIHGALLKGALTAGDADTYIGGNEVNITGGTFDYVQYIYGGDARGYEAKLVENNKVNIKNVTIEGLDATHKTMIYGGHAAKVATNGNSVTIENAIIGNYVEVYGGYTESKDAEGNFVTIKNTIVGADCIVYGGNSYNNDGYSPITGKDAKNNRVEILDGVTMEGDTYFKTVYGGVGKDNVEFNEVSIGSGAYRAIVGGVNASNNGSFSVSNNSVKMTGGTLVGGTPTIVGWDSYDGHVYGAIGGSNGTTVTENTVELDGVTIKDSVKIYGAFSLNNATIKNSVTVDNLQCEEGKYSEIYGGYSNNISSYENTVTIKSGAWGKVYGGYGGAGAESNTVVIEGGSFKSGGPIYGGYGNNGTVGGDNEDSKDKGNKVIINTTGTVDSNIYGGWSNSSGIAGYNKVIIESVTFSKNIVGGRGAANAENNEVTISGGTFNGSGQYIYGGLANSGNATGNTVTIIGGTFSDNYKLYGGYTTSGTSSNNTLNLKIKMTGKASEVKYFQNMNFTLPSNITNGDVMLSTASVTYDNTIIGVDAANGVKLNKDDVITLIEAENINGTTIGNDGASVLGGAAIVKLNGNNLILTLLKDFEQKKSAGNEDQQKAPVEGIAAAVQTVNMSADLASGEGMKSLIAETAGGVTNTFGALTTGQSKYKTGSHVDVDGWGILVGAGKTKEWGNGEATSLGVFFEYGKGDFDTYNDNVHGDGNSKNQGIGFMMRHKMMNNTYYEGNIRYGKQSTEWGESEIGSYDTDSRYYGISIGMGHIYQAGKNEIDVYGRYTYGHVGACDATVGTSEYHFDSVKSHRVRVGGKYNFKQKNSNAKPYVGLAWEHEFKGETRATISGVGEAPAPSMKGNTGILEVGCDWNVSKKWTVGLGANAYVGKRKGWDGMARIFYNF